MAERRRAERGQALLIVLIAMTVLVPLGGFAAMQARLDFLVQHHARAASETFAVAESGLEHALADLDADGRFELLRAGPDRRAGTGDDGEFPFAVAPPAFFPAAPFRYEVRVTESGPDVVEIVARGFGPLGATRAVAAAVLRDAVPYLPAALASEAADPRLVLGDGWRIEGAAATDGQPGVPALALRDDAVAERVTARLDADERGRLQGPGGPPSLGAAAVPDVAALLAAAARRPDARRLGSDVSGALGSGLFVADAGLRARDLSGSGILLVDGPLELAGSVAFEGLIAVAGDLRVADGAAFGLDGALLQGPAGGLLELRGSGRMRFDRDVLMRLAAAFPGLLPQRARVTGWRELSEAAR